MAKGKDVSVLMAALLAAQLLLVGCAQTPGEVTRVGQVIGVKAEDIGEYKRLHADTWPGVLNLIRKANVRNYSIYLGEVSPGEHYLFAYYEYVGADHDADVAQIAQDETMKRWWKLTDPLQKPLPTRKQGQWWAPWEEVFHFAGPPSKKTPQRFGSIVGLKGDRKSIIAYVQLHAAVWPGVLDAIEQANIRNYSIFLGKLDEDRHLLFSYFEYVGDDFEADMQASGADEVTQIWWTYTDPLQIRLPGTPDGDQWKSTEEVFHTD